MRCPFIHKRYLCLFLMILFVSGCEREYFFSPQPLIQHNQDLLKDVVTPKLTPIRVDEGEFYRASGFLDEQTILYLTENSMGTRLYSYQLHTGEKKLLLDGEHPVVSVSISPSRSFIFVHSSLSTNKALVSILNQNGELLFSEEIASTELAMEWNPFNEEIILLSAFTEDWDYTVYEMNIETQALIEIEVPQPFAYWLNENELVYLDWEDSPSLVTTVKRYNINNRQIEPLFSNLYLIDSFGEVMMTVAVDEEQQSNAVYRFYTPTLEERFSFTHPHLSLYSGWLVPYYDFNVKNQVFTVFQPHYSTEADIYQGGFQLVAYDVGAGSREVLVDQMENQPITCSPNGTYCLMGYYFESLFIKDTREVVPIVE